MKLLCARQRFVVSPNVQCICVLEPCLLGGAIIFLNLLLNSKKMSSKPRKAENLLAYIKFNDFHLLSLFNKGIGL